MKPVVTILIVGFATAALCQAQPLRVYSEFRRVDTKGEIIKQDSAGEPREIISPAVVRGMHATYRVVIATPPGEKYWMYVGSNPDGVLPVTVYREKLTPGGPTGLQEEKESPIGGTLSAQQPVESFLLDVYVPPNAPTKRIRIEAQLNFENRWVIYPLEVRVLDGAIAEAAASDATIAEQAAAAPSFSAGLAAFRARLCQVKAEESAASATLSQASLLARNASQDFRLLQASVAKIGSDATVAGIVKAFGAPDLGAWCTLAAKPLMNVDSVSRARDFLIRSIAAPE